MPILAVPDVRLHASFLAAMAEFADEGRTGDGSMLAATLPLAHDLGIDPALVTCDPDNVGSRRTIEANGGIPDGERRGKLRFWLPTG